MKTSRLTFDTAIPVCGGGKRSFADKCVPKCNLGTRGAAALLVTIALLLLIAPPALADPPSLPGLTIPPLPTPGGPATVASAPPVTPAAAPSAPTTSAAGIPTSSFPADRYAALWTKSPFAVATSETVGDESPDYFLVGVANIDGISYASVVESKPPQDHFLISTDQAENGMTLKSINRNRDGSETYAVVVKDGQLLTLKLQQAPAEVAANESPGAPMMNNMPGAMMPQIPMPGGANSVPSIRPFTRFHRPPIHLPNMPGSQPPPMPQSRAPQLPPPPQPAPPPPPQ